MKKNKIIILSLLIFFIPFKNFLEIDNLNENSEKVSKFSRVAEITKTKSLVYLYSDINIFDDSSITYVYSYDNNYSDISTPEKYKTQYLDELNYYIKPIVISKPTSDEHNFLNKDLNLFTYVEYNDQTYKFNNYNSGVTNIPSTSIEWKTIEWKQYDANHNLNYDFDSDNVYFDFSSFESLIIDLRDYENLNATRLCIDIVDDTCDYTSSFNEDKTAVVSIENDFIKNIENYYIAYMSYPNGDFYIDTLDVFQFSKDLEEYKNSINSNNQDIQNNQNSNDNNFNLILIISLSLVALITLVINFIVFRKKFKKA